MFKKKDSTIGSKMLETGVFQEVGIGGTPFHSGFQTTGKKLFVLAPFKSFKNFQDVEKLRTCIEKVSTK
jgi:hypothetical protein